MDKKTMYKLTYGLFVLTSASEGKDSGCIINTAQQVTSEPNRISIAVNQANFTHDLVKKSGKFNISIISQAAEFALFKHFGFQSGRDVDKFEKMHLTPIKGNVVKAPLIKESPVNIECVVKDAKALGSHDMFIAEVAAVHADEKYIDEKNKFHFDKARPIVYSHGSYMSLGRKIGTFGYSVRKK